MQFLTFLVNGFLVVIGASCPWTCGHAGPFGVSVLFETFSPYNMIRIFEFNDNGWIITEDCLKDMFRFMEGLRSGENWAVKLYDATGYYSGGIYDGVKYRFGSPNQCRHIQKENYRKQDKSSLLAYSVVNSSVPFPVQLLSVGFTLKLLTDEESNRNIQQSVCFPKSCTKKDLHQILTANLPAGNHIVKNVTLRYIRVVNSGKYNVFDENILIVLWILIILLVFLNICAYFSESLSFVEENSENIKKDFNDDVPYLGACECVCPLENQENVLKTNRNSNEITNGINTESLMNAVNTVESIKAKKSSKIGWNRIFDRPKIKKETNPPSLILSTVSSKGDYSNTLKTSNFVRRLLASFSVARNVENLLLENTNNEKEISSVIGLKGFCSIFFLFVHSRITYEFVSNGKEIVDKINREKSLIYSYIVDMYFFLSAANLSHLYHRTNTLNAMNFFDQFLHFAILIVHKISSIILPYIFTLIFSELTAKYFYFNSMVELPALEYRTCELNKWRNILFIDIFFPIEERCMPWTWFLSLEIQFYIISCVILQLTQVHPKYAGAISMIIFLSSITASVFLGMNEYSFLLKHKSYPLIKEFNLIGEEIWIRIPPYLLGLCLGYCVHKTRGSLKMNIFVNVFGWIACLLIGIGFIFGCKLFLIKMNLWLRASILVLTHVVWCLILFWIVLVTISQYGGFLKMLLNAKLFNVLGKLLTCSILLGPTIIRGVIENDEVIFNYSSSVFQMILSFGFALVVNLITFLMHVFLEAPLVAVSEALYQQFFQ